MDREVTLQSNYNAVETEECVLEHLDSDMAVVTDGNGKRLSLKCGGRAREDDYEHHGRQGLHHPVQLRKRVAQYRADIDAVNTASRSASALKVNAMAASKDGETVEIDGRKYKLQLVKED